MVIPPSAHALIWNWHNALDSEAGAIFVKRRADGGYRPINRESMLERIWELRELAENVEYFLLSLQARAEGRPEPPPPDTLLGPHLSPVAGGVNPIRNHGADSMRLRRQMVNLFLSAGAYLHAAGRRAAPAGDSLWSTAILDGIFRHINDPFPLVPEWVGEPWRRRFLCAYAAGVPENLIAERLGIGAAELEEADKGWRIELEEQTLFQTLVCGIHRYLKEEFH